MANRPLKTLDEKAGLHQRPTAQLPVRDDGGKSPFRALHYDAPMGLIAGYA